jgi:signal peptidase I
VRVPRRRSAVLAAAVALLVLGGWVLFAPAVIGGSSTYVTVVGDSMLPKLHPGDLAIVRSQSGYRVGDVVAYKSPALGELVLHRIVAISAGSFSFRGDHNTFVDPVRTPASAIAGKLWMRVPTGGTVLAGFASPRGAALLLTLLALSLMSGVGKSTLRRRGRGRVQLDSFEPAFSFTAPLVPLAGAPLYAVRSNAAPEEDWNGRDWVPEAAPEPPEDDEEPSDEPAPRASRVPGHAALFAVGRRGQLLFAAAGMVAAAALLVCVIAFMRPATTAVSSALPYTSTGTFSYTAQPSGTVYGGGEVTTGQPIFLSVVQRAAFAFEYRLNAKVRHSMHGEGSLSAVLSSANGWTRTIPLQPPTPFAGDSVTLHGVLDLSRVTALVHELESVTGVEGANYFVSIVPSIAGSGEVGGKPIRQIFAPALPFEYDGVQLQLSQPATTSSAAKPVDTLHPVKPGTVKVVEHTRNSLSLLGVSLPVQGARIGALVLAVLATAALVALAMLSSSAAATDEPARINAKYGAWIVTLAPGNVPAAAVDVASFDDLLRLADRGERMILHEQQGTLHSYLVEDGGALYRYRVHATAPDSTGPPWRPAFFLPRGRGSSGEGPPRWKALLLLGILAAVLTTLVSAFAAANTINATIYLGKVTRSASPNDWKPSECSMTIDQQVVGAGVVDDHTSTTNDLLIGSSGGDTITGGAGDDCLVGGDGPDSFDGGPGSNVCIGTATSSFQNCQTIVYRP